MPCVIVLRWGQNGCSVEATCGWCCSFPAKCAFSTYATTQLSVCIAAPTQSDSLAVSAGKGQQGNWSHRSDTLVLKHLVSQACVGNTNLAITIDDIKEYWDRFNRINPVKPLDTTTVTVFAVTASCDNPLYEIILFLHPDMDEVTSADLKVIVLCLVA